jgi:hypothetical protein
MRMSYCHQFPMASHLFAANEEGSVTSTFITHEDPAAVLGDHFVSARECLFAKASGLAFGSLQSCGRKLARRFSAASG